MDQKIPRGVWAIASERTAQDLPGWIDAAGPAAAWSYRRPPRSDRDALEALQTMRQHAPFLAVHGRSDLALLSQADALIAGAQSLPWEVLRHRLLSSGFAPCPALGAAVHNAQEHATACAMEAAFLVLGPVWETPSKRGILPAQGVDKLVALADRGRPVLAVGGIDRPERVAAAHAAGAHGVLVLRAAEDSVLLQELVSAWQEAERA